LAETKTILITGGTGTLGHALAEEFLRNGYTVRIFSRDEFKQKKMSLIFPECHYFIGDVRDKERLDLACENVDYIIHCAALKHIATAQYNPFEIIKTNIIGTQNVIDCAMKHSVEGVVLVSTDKAVEPINLYGASKLCAEKMMESANNYKGNRKTQFKFVRYGNVWGSRGSVIDVWREQNPIWLRGKESTRFHLMIDEAVLLVQMAMDPDVKMMKIIPGNLKAYNVHDLAIAYSNVTGKEMRTTIKPEDEKTHEKLDDDLTSDRATKITVPELEKLVESYLFN